MTKFEIAQAVREACEKFARKTRPSDLCGMCAIASVLLAKLFRKHGYNATVVYGEYQACDHCWVISDGELWDVTFTQFNGYADKVTFFEADSIPSGYKSREQYKSERCKAFNSQFKRWPKGQRPFFPLIKKVRYHLSKEVQRASNNQN